MQITQKFPTLIHALITVESQGNDNAVGDRSLKYHAYGCLQIRQPYITDVNRVFGTKYTTDHCMGLTGRTVSIDIFEKYMSIYATPKRLGREVTAQDIARIHNGGPNGWKSGYTVGYWLKVKKLL